MKRTTWITGATVGVVSVALVGWAFAPRPLEVELATVTRGPFETTLDEDGRTRLADRYGVSAPLAGRLARITLREGDEVKAGDVLARLQPALAPLLDERSQREQAARVEGCPGGRAAGRQARGGRTGGAGARARRPQAQRTAGATGIHRAHQADRRPPVGAGGAEGTGSGGRRRACGSPRPANRRAWRWGWCAHRRPAKGGAVRAACPGGGPRAEGAPDQRGHGGAGHPADRDRRRVAAGGGGRAADQRRPAGFARQCRAHRTLGRAGGVAGPRAAGRAGGLHQGVGAGRGGAAGQRDHRHHQPARTVVGAG